MASLPASEVHPLHGVIPTEELQDLPTEPQTRTGYGRLFCLLTLGAILCGGCVFRPPHAGQENKKHQKI